MPIYEYDCGVCGPFSETRPMAASSLPVPCPRCAVEAPRTLSATAIHRTGGGRKRPGAEPTLVTKEHRPPPKSKFTEKKAAARAAAHSGDARPWMIGH